MTTAPRRPGHPLHLPAGSAVDGTDPLLVTPASAGWRYCGLRVVELAAGASRTLSTGADEYAVLPLANPDATIVVEADGRRIELEGRDDPFARVTDFAYLPRDCEARIAAVGAAARIALPSAGARRRLEVRHGRVEDVPVEVRGAGAATRQVNNFMHPDAFATDRLTCVELLTPEGNTSSYPPHKHDVDEPADDQAVLEEIYYFEMRGDGGVGRAGGTSDGAALHRTYTGDGEIDATVEVRSGDAFLIPRGYHGPCVALPGYDLYYLNVLAGPAETRSLAFKDDPAHAWVRASWASQPRDPRVPMCDAGGRRAGDGRARESAERGEPGRWRGGAESGR